MLPGARIPADGEVVQGHTHVDESMVTGESVPVAKHTGDGIISGTVNCRGALLIRATRVGGDTTLAQVMHSWDGHGCAAAARPCLLGTKASVLPKPYSS